MRTLLIALTLTAATLTAVPSTAAAATTPHELAKVARVRIQSTQLTAGWHEGTVQIVEGCALIWTADPTSPIGRTGLGLMFIQKMERQDGATWVAVPVSTLMTREPKACQEGNG